MLRSAALNAKSLPDAPGLRALPGEIPTLNFPVTSRSESSSGTILELDCTQLRWVGRQFLVAGRDVVDLEEEGDDIDIVLVGKSSRFVERHVGLDVFDEIERRGSGIVAEHRASA